MSSNSSIDHSTRAALAAAMDRSEEDLARGRMRPLDQVLADIHRRTAGRLARREQRAVIVE